MTEQELQKTIIHSQDLAFLLTYQPWELESDWVLAALGKVLMTTRQEKGMTQGKMADQLGISKGHIGLMEQGPNQPNGNREVAQRYVTFHRFLAYMENLGVSCVEGFTQALERKKQSTKSSNPDSHVLRKQAAVVHGQEILEKVQQAAQDLRVLGLPITTKAIAQKVGLTRRYLYSLPQVSSFLEQIGCKKRHRKKGDSLEEQEILGLVRQAIKQLEAQGQSATLSLISELVGLRMRTLLSYPQVQRLLEEVETQNALLFYSTLEQGVDELKKAAQEPRLLYLREGPLKAEGVMTEVLQAIEQLGTSGQPVTCSAIVGILKRPLRELYAYPQVKAILRPVQKAEQARVQRLKLQLREDELLNKFEEAVFYLESNGQPVTQIAVSQIMRVSPSTLRYYPRIQAFWTQRVANCREEEKEKEKLREDTLLKEAEDALGLLGLQEQPVTQQAVQSFIGVSRGIWRKYPSLKTLIVSFYKPKQLREIAGAD